MYNSAHPQVQAFVTALSRKLGAVTATDSAGAAGNVVVLRQGARVLFIVSAVSGVVYHSRRTHASRTTVYGPINEVVQRHSG
jgi:hypothetical protein